MGISKQVGWTLCSSFGALQQSGKHYGCERRSIHGEWSRLKVYYEPDVVPLHHIDVFTMEEEPERPA
jgi:hypothetical protein